MLGHETDFGQLECLNTISSENFALKKIGYLGLSLFFNEKSDVLLLATNRIMIDLDNPSQYVVALALTSFCEISDAYMCETLFLAILAKTRSPHKYVKKKALLACTLFPNKKA
jgi:AP-1 complex subunit gamma-1